jgi:hypothetical protein
LNANVAMTETPIAMPTRTAVAVTRMTKSSSSAAIVGLGALCIDRRTTTTAPMVPTPTTAVATSRNRAFCSTPSS